MGQAAFSRGARACLEAEPFSSLIWLRRACLIEREYMKAAAFALAASADLFGSAGGISLHATASTASYVMVAPGPVRLREVCDGFAQAGGDADAQSGTGRQLSEQIRYSPTLGTGIEADANVMR